jgi:hypothetical protein
METQGQSVKLVPMTDTEAFEAVGYDTAARCLVLKLHDGTTIRMEKVPQFRYQGLMGSPRKDAYFRAFIKGQFLSKPV